MSRNAFAGGMAHAARYLNCQFENIGHRQIIMLQKAAQAATGDIFQQQIWATIKLFKTHCLHNVGVFLQRDPGFDFSPESRHQFAVLAEVLMNRFHHKRITAVHIGHNIDCAHPAFEDIFHLKAARPVLIRDPGSHRPARSGPGLLSIPPGLRGDRRMPTQQKALGPNDCRNVMG